MNTIAVLFLIAFLGYVLGSIPLFGIKLGASGVLIVALVFGHFGTEIPSVVRELGLALFVGAVGFIAGPTFFRNFKKSATAYVVLGLLITVVGGMLTAAAIGILALPVPLAVGMFTGALTSTPGLAAAVEATGDTLASVGYGIAYPFGVVGVVLFVQLIPKFLKVDIAAETKTLDEAATKDVVQPAGKTIFSDPTGLIPFSAAMVAGIALGTLAIPLPGGMVFRLGTSGGPLLTGLAFGHFQRVGPVGLKVPDGTLEVFRELGLIFFLMGAGTGAGKGFLEVLSQYGWGLFLAGAVITLLPMIIGYLVASKVFHLRPLDNLGAICGGMTSTPALGALISVSGSTNVASSYAAAYPVALIAVVLIVQVLTLVFS